MDTNSKKDGMAQSNTLTLKSPLSLDKQAKLYKAIGSSLAPNISKKQDNNKNITPPKTQENTPPVPALVRKKRLQEAITWLMETYPHCFNQEAPKPLKKGILNDIVMEVCPYTKTFLRQALAFYTNSLVYQNALLQERQRYSLEGTPLKESLQRITDAEKEIAKKYFLILNKKHTIA